jgi:hypothetical protein
MKTWKIAYWIVTVLYSLFMVSTAVPDVLSVPGAMQLVGELGYPPYLLFIVGYAKILGVIGILQRKWPFLREWAYAGLAIDTLGALISHVTVDGLTPFLIPALLGFVLTLASYALLRKAYGNTARLAALS